jgi:hypothetical protein
MTMRIRRFVALLVTASLAFWAPSVVPLKALPIVTCGVNQVEYQTIDTAYANPCPIVPCSPNQVQYRTIDTAYAACRPMFAHGHAPAPWAPIAVFVGTISVMINAAYIWNRQCRELSSQEAVTSTLLPFLGIAFDAQASKCRR